MTMAAIRGLKLSFDDNGQAKAIATEEPSFEYRCHIKDCEFFEVVKEEIELRDKPSVTICHLLCMATEVPVSIFDIERQGECPKGYWKMVGFNKNKIQEK